MIRQPSRSAILFALIWFALTLGVSGASPWVNPQAQQWVCTATGGMALAGDSDGDGSADAATSATLDCPLCLFGGLPPEAGAPAVASQVPACHAGCRAVAARVALASAAPLPARGPPSLA